jgi:glycosyltransferase involved in cell wall biosynthesis
MNVLWLSHFVPYPPTGHGALQRTHHLLKEASKRHHVHLVALCPPATLESPEAIANAARELSGFAASVTVFPLTASRLRRVLWAASTFVQPTSFWEKRYWSQEMYAHVRRLAGSMQFDLVHVDTVFLGQYLSAVPDVPVVLNHHNVESHLLHRRAASERTPWRRLLFEAQARKVAALERRTGGPAAQNLVVSDLDCARLREMVPGAKITTVPNGVDVDFFRVSLLVRAEPATLVFAGSMNWFPNRDGILFFLSQVWPKLLQDDPRRRMTVIGRDPPAAIAASGRAGHLRVLGFVDDVRPHIEASAIYVCPIRVGGGTRLKILDALAMSRPVVSTSVGVEGLGLVEGEHYVSADTPEEFVNQIRRLEADPELRRRLGEAGRDFVVRRYSWRGIAELLDRAYADAACAGSSVVMSQSSAGPARSSWGSTGRSRD